MVNDKIHFRLNVTGKVLDEYLAGGWYRIRDLMFTTDHIVLEKRVIPVQWLRYDLSRLVYSRSARKLLNRNSKLFERKFKPAEITVEHEAVFSKYRRYVDLEISESVKETLFTQEPFPIFDTQLIEIRKDSRLIAVGYFDLGGPSPGSGSAAGILNFYDPEFRKFSLGKWLMLLAIEYVKKTGRRYFYPGYVALGYGKFDYKLQVAEKGIERYMENRWES